MIKGDRIRIKKGEHAGKTGHVRGTEGYFVWVELDKTKGVRIRHIVTVHRAHVEAENEEET